jgi:hypothetical protein
LSKPIPFLERQASYGNQKRLAVLEQRKQSTTMSQMWKAHETGFSLQWTVLLSDSRSSSNMLMQHLHLQ